jgi:hypothetical protein
VLAPEQLSKSTDELISHLERQIDLFNRSDLFIWVIDQYEEKVQGKRDVPTEFVERLSLLDRGVLRNHPMLFLWLTTDQQFQAALAKATSRNECILVQGGFELVGIPREEWPPVIEDTFSFHNEGKELADFGILKASIDIVSRQSDTIGRAIEQIGVQLADPKSRLEDISEYQVILVWPVVDGTGIERVSGFTNPSLGYKLNWSAWYNRLTEEDRKQLPLNEYNRARLYFDLRLVPVPVADLQAVCLSLDDDAYTPAESYLAQLKRTHLFAVVSAAEDERSIGTLSGRESKRSAAARTWYSTVTDKPTAVGKRLAKCLTTLGLPSKHEHTVHSTHSEVRADVISERQDGHQKKVLIELKLFSPQKTNPSGIRDEIRKTLKKYAQLAGYIQRQ